MKVNEFWNNSAPSETLSREGAAWQEVVAVCFREAHSQEKCATLCWERQIRLKSQGSPLVHD